VSVKANFVEQVENRMLDVGVTKSALAEYMNTSRSQIDRILDEDNESITLNSMFEVCHALGLKLIIEIGE